MDARDQRLLRVVACLGDLNTLAAQVRYELARGTDVWHDGERIDYFLNPITHQLLNLPLQRAGLAHWNVVSEALRLGALIFIILAKRMSRSYPGTAKVYATTLVEMLSDKPEEFWSSPSLRTVLIWLLVLCYISDPSHEESLASVDGIARTLGEMELESWSEAMAYVRMMPWLDIFEPSCSQLEQDLSQHYPWLFHQVQVRPW